MAAVWGAYGSIQIRFNGGQGTLCQNGDNDTPMCFQSFLVDHGYRRKGVGKTILRLVKKIARKYNKPVYLNASPFDDRPMDLETLKNFYNRMGFHFDPSFNDCPNRLIYYPPECIKKRCKK